MYNVQVHVHVYTCTCIFIFTTKVVSSKSVLCEVYSIQHYVIRFVNDLRQVSGFLQVLQFPPPIKLTTTILNESHIQFICDKQGPSKDCNVTIGYLTKPFIYVQIQDKNIWFFFKTVYIKPIWPCHWWLTVWPLHMWYALWPCYKWYTL
jgi:hypothetical protein